MKKFVLCFMLIITLIFGCFDTKIVNATQNDYSNYSTFNWLEKFVTENPARTTGTQGGQQSAEWIVGQMQDMGFSVVKQEFEAQVSGVAGVSQKTAKTCNIIATKGSNPTLKKVVVGAHYDNATDLYNGSLVSGGEGAMDNGSGVAVVLDLAQKFVDNSLPFNVEFVFFGAEELGMVGSNYYVSQLSQKQKDQILLMINVDVVASGDNLYVWGEDKKTPQANYFADVSQGKIVKTPANTKVIGVNSGYRPYYSVCQMSDHMEFLSQGIPVAAFFSGNFNSGTFSFVENKGKTDVSHTKNDTINYLKSNFGIKFAQNMQTVSDTIYHGVFANADDFATQVENARDYIVDDFWLSLGNASLILLVLIVCAGLFAYSYYKKLQKRAIVGTAQAKTTTVFEKPDEDDIFTFRS